MNHISQTLIKSLLRPYCGHYLNAVYNLGYQTEPTDAMIDGLVFEQHLLGKTARGKLYEIPKLKSGGISKREQDLLMIVENARQILSANSIIFTEVQIHFTHQKLSGHIDARGTYHNAGYLFDVKYTSLNYSKWDREYIYGDTMQNFLIQARQYQATEPLPFMFLVFGPDWCRFIRVDYDWDAVKMHIDRANEALNTFNNMQFTPSRDARLCFTCPMRGSCDKISYKIEIEDL